MKILLLTLALFAVGLSSCQKQEKSVTPDSVTLVTHPATDPLKWESAEAGTRAVTIAATSDWTAVSNDSWLTVSPSSGGAGIQDVTLSYDANTTGEARSASVTFSSASNSETYVLTQKN